MKAILETPTGFSDPRFYTSNVQIVGYVYGFHSDAAGYGREAQTVLAIVASKAGLLDAVPLSWLRAATPLVATDEERT